MAEIGRNERESAAVWSPDGTMLAAEDALQACSGGVGSAEGVIVARADGSGSWQAAVGEMSSGQIWNSSNSPSWSPGGDSLAFVTSTVDGPVGDAGIFVVRVDGSLRRRVTGPEVQPYRLTWLAGGMIAFLGAPPPPYLAQDPPPPPELYVIHSDGSNLRRLTDGGAYVDPDGRRGLVVSPDGRCIAHRRRDWEETFDELRVVCLDGQQTIVNREQPPDPEGPSIYVWLTDGRLAVLGTAECIGLLAVRLESGTRECVVY